jgi:hypothetical protein
LPLWAGQGIAGRVGFFVSLVGFPVGGIDCVGGVGFGVDGGQSE